MQTPLLQIRNLTFKLPGKTVLDNVSFSVMEGQVLAIVGPSGSGKTTLLNIIAGKHFSNAIIEFNTKGNEKPKIVTISQQHYFKNLSNTASFYYQQRFNSADSEDTLTVNEALLVMGATQQMIDETTELLGMAHVQNTRLIQLSNGEHKRFQLATAILQNAEWLLLDNAYTGLDVVARKLLDQIIRKLISKGIKIIMVAAVTDVPDVVTHIAILENGQLYEPINKKEFNNSSAITTAMHNNGWQVSAFASVEPAYDYADFAFAIRMVGTSVVYNNRKILDNINWEVKKGECWNVSGHNGSGKSTLLSLVNGDNPQAFANEIYLFDRKKGSGESIWDIKQKIGYVSPELHHYFDATAICYEVVASGLFDTIGLFRKLNAKQKAIVDQWVGLLKIDAFAKRLFKQLSNGEQRLVLLARALVKNPPLLILDEPCQGLDREAAKHFIGLINDICVHMKKTMIYVSHYQEEIPPCVTRTLQLTEGKIAA